MQKLKIKIKERLKKEKNQALQFEMQKQEIRS